MGKRKKGPGPKPPADDGGVLVPILIAALSCIILFLGGAVAFGVWYTVDSRAAQQETEPPEEIPSVPQIRTIAQDGSVIYNLPCGMELTYYDSVPGDVTGRWRAATTSFGSSPSNHAAEYYNNVFSSDDEVHAICDTTLKTTTRIKVEQGLLIVDTLKYVDGEEKDAKILFSGDVLRSKVFDKETGKSVKVGKEDKPSPTPEEESPSPSVSPSPTPSETPEPSEEQPPESQTPTPTPSNTPQTPEGNGGGGDGFDTERFDRPDWPDGKFLAASTSNKYHRTNCSTGAARIRPENEIWFSSEQEAKAAGYERCGICWK